MGDCGAAVSPIGLPQPPQNLAPVSFSKPQAGQGNGKAAPHWAQKRLVAAFSAMQLEQRIGAPGREAILRQHNPSKSGVEAEGRRPARRAGHGALVRHGADPRAALAGALWVSAEDIRVKDSPD